jgi:hypothetical protein
MQIRFLPALMVRPRKSLLAQVSIRVHVKAEQEYHSHAYAMRVTGDITELLVVDKNKKLHWLGIEHIEVVDEADPGVS